MLLYTRASYTPQETNREFHKRFLLDNVHFYGYNTPMTNTITFSKRGITSCDISASTNGRGLWSSEKKTVNIHKMRFKPYIYITGDDTSDGTLYVDAFFYAKNWNTWRDGLIYTDEKWLREFRKEFYAMFPDLKKIDARIDYTEQGMQGTNYVSLIISVDPARMGRFRDFLNDIGVRPEIIDIGF